ncbi:MAG: glycosyltransferase, partial [Lishizhenia sp.]
MQSKRPNVLFLASWFPNKNHQTVGNFIQRHAELANNVATIYVLFATAVTDQKERFQIEHSLENNVQITRVYYRRIKHRIPLIHSFLRLKRYQKAMELGAESLNQSFDFVHVNTFWFAGIAALMFQKKMKISYLITEHWSGFLPQNNAFKSSSFLMKQLAKRIFKKAKFVLPVSDDLGESLKKNGLISKYISVPNVINVDLFSPANTTKSDICRFIHISTADEEHKNFSGILEAFSLVTEEYVLEIITDGDLVEVEKKINHFNLQKKVTLRGTSKPEEVAQSLQNADCLVQFSNVETFSIVIAEAWSVGIPCIYSKCGGLTNIEDEQLGIQIEIGNIEALTLSIRSFTKGEYSFNIINDNLYSRVV